ncbi:hypothetical protein CDES_05305 [Corynebacterium deserti GIMN1.010]|uniref:Secreted protein n=1 Tax=Corynebacterium deserti GIMN1.010 TaxID=931089 RepID=A0A0M5IIG8_9CORY|nr:hypothetical protein [Corynebacterium deserti]ALC05498.1 hypothetical protein CDES_05305 [Corynebacterium deserti GIMN1.010]
MTKNTTRLLAVAASVALAFPAIPVASAVTPVEQAFNISSNMSSGLPVDQWGRPNEQVRQQIQQAVNQPWVPQEVKDIVSQAMGFISGDGDGGEIQVPNDAPRIAQFFWPTRAENCIGGNSASVGSAFAVPGPAPLPVPGVGEGQTSFTFTALGTGPLAEQQNTAMTVQWANLSNFTHGTTTLGNTGINPDGPSTISGVADTGRGIIVAYTSGGLTTTTDSGSANCNFIPTAVVFDVR